MAESLQDDGVTGSKEEDPSEQNRKEIKELKGTKKPKKKLFSSHATVPAHDSPH